MKIEKLDVTLQLIGKAVKFWQSHAKFGSFRFGTELTIQIANIGYFKITSGDHGVFLSLN